MDLAVDTLKYEMNQLPAHLGRKFGVRAKRKMMRDRG